MIVIGTDLVENYLANHAGHQGIKAARTQYYAWLDIVSHAQWRNPEDVKVCIQRRAFSKEVALSSISRAMTTG